MVRHLSDEVLMSRSLALRLRVDRGEQAGCKSRESWRMNYIGWLTSDDEAMLLQPGNLIDQRLVPHFLAGLEDRWFPSKELGLDSVGRGGHGV